MPHEVERRALARYLEEHNLKHTKQRDAIVDHFLGATGHITSEDLYELVRKDFPSIGYTTVYRTLKLLCEAGIASEALRLISSYAFESFDLDRLQANVFEWNPASSRVLEKSGYALEARIHRSVYKDGQLIDGLLYARLRESPEEAA